MKLFLSTVLLAFICQIQGFFAPPPLPAVDVKQSDECDVNIDVVFIVDESWSITDKQYELVKQLVIDSIVAIGESTTIAKALVTFNDRVYEQFDFGDLQNVNYLTDKVRNMPRNIGMNTQLAKAMALVKDVTFKGPFVRINSAKVVVLVTDGNPSTNVARNIAEYEEAGIIRYAVGVTDTVRDDFLEKFASHPDYVLHVDDFVDLKGIEKKVIKDICTIEPPLPTIIIPVKPTIKVCAKQKADVIFVVDSSMSTTSFWNRLVGFAADAIQAMYKVNDEDDIQVGFIRYADDPKMLIKLSDYANDKAGLVDAVRKIPREGIQTYTTSAMRLARTKGFTEENGYRPGVQKVIVLITDGYAAKHSSLLEEMKVQDSANIIRVAVGIHRVKEAEMAAVKGDSGKYIQIDNVSELDDFVSTLVHETCTLTPAN